MDFGIGEVQTPFPTNGTLAVVVEVRHGFVCRFWWDCDNKHGSPRKNGVAAVGGQSGLKRGNAATAMGRSRQMAKPGHQKKIHTYET